MKVIASIALSFTQGMLLSLPACAHPVIITKNAFAGGLFHSFTGLDHALFMLCVGFLSRKLAESKIKQYGLSLNRIFTEGLFKWEVWSKLMTL